MHCRACSRLLKDKAWSKMSKRSNRKDDFAKFKEKVAKKRRGKEEATTSTDMDYITVQRLSSSVERRYQKYARIRALTSVPLGCEPTIQNIKEACKRHFDVADGIYCDVLAGERGPSWSGQISNWKVIHVRFIKRTDESQICEKPEFNTKKQWKSLLTPTKAPPPTSMSAKVVASVPLSAMLQIGKLIQPTVEIVTVKLEEFKLTEKSWGQPFEVTLSLAVLQGNLQLKYLLKDYALTFKKVPPMKAKNITRLHAINFS